MRNELYFCTDIEATGQCFARGSILTVGMVPVLMVDKKYITLTESLGVIEELYVRFTPRLGQITVEAPYGKEEKTWVEINDKETMEWWEKIRQENPEAHKEAFFGPTFDPPGGIGAVISYVAKLADRFNAVPIFVSSPIGYDWDFIRNYMYLYYNMNPFGNPGKTLDPKSFLAGYTGESIRNCNYNTFKRYFDALDLKKYEPKHVAINDARRLADMFVTMMNASEADTKAADKMNGVSNEQ